MDKALDMRRGARRLGPVKRERKPSGHKLASALDGCGVVDTSERPKKEKIRGQRFLDIAISSNEDSEMSGSTEGDEEVHRRPSPGTGSNKRFKLQRKPLDECNVVDPSSVPRKLRSAMSKRNIENVSPISPEVKKLNSDWNGIESPPINGVKKSKQSMKQGGCSDQPHRQAVLGPIITKDEEEVVETLYALAQMFPDNNSGNKKVDLEASEAKRSPSPEIRESSRLVCGAPNEVNMKSSCPSTAAETQNLSPSVEGSPLETLQVNSLTETTIRESHSVLEDQKVDLESDNAVPQADQQISSFFESDHKNETLSGDTKSFSVPSDLCSDIGATWSKQEETLLFGREKTNGTWPVAMTAYPQEHHLIKASKVACIEGSSAIGSCDAGVQGPASKSSATIYPTSTWIDATVCATSLGSARNGISIEKDVRCVIDRRKTWKKSTRHVYISHLIRAYQVAYQKNNLATLPNQLNLSEGRGTDVMAAKNPIEVRISSHEGTSASSINVSTTTKNPNEARASVIRDKSHWQDQQKQSCDFLSLSPGGGKLEVNCSSNSAGRGLEPLSQLHVPYLHSLMHHRPVMHFSPPCTHYPSSPYPDQLTSTASHQGQLQLPYAINPFHSPQRVVQVSSGKQQQEQQQQHHQMWGPYLTAQHSPGGVSGLHLPKWQNGRPHFSPSPFPCAQALIAHAPSMEMLGSKFSPGTQQQQFYAMGSSLSSSKVTRHHHRLPAGYDDAGGLRPEGSQHLRLLCNAEGT